MKATIIIIGLIAAIFIPSIVFAIENAPRISDREIVERLARLEEGQKTTNESIKQLREDMNKQFDRIDSQLDRLAAIFTALVVFTLGFAIWDRRTMVRPFEDKVKRIEEDIAENRNKLHALIDALKSLSKTDEKVAEILKKFNLL
jgi:uncharacterized coiled-coil DUF342 family protein